jgi:hypothetical protein
MRRCWPKEHPRKAAAVDEGEEERSSLLESGFSIQNAFFTNFRSTMLRYMHAIVKTGESQAFETKNDFKTF